MDKKIQILGGGPAGLALAYYSRKSRIPYQLFEASQRVGGNAMTFRSGIFAYDSGAHRFHDKDSEVTEDVLALMGDRIRKIDAPSQIFSQGKFIHFPLSPYNLGLKLGLKGVIRAFNSWMQEQLFHSPDKDSFESVTRNKYGTYLADRFLLNYSQKLWGIAPDTLSPEVSGNRLKGLDLKTFLIEAVRGSKAKTSHLDGAFYYPTHGYGQLMDALAGDDLEAAIEVNSQVTAVHHRDFTIESIELNNHQSIEAEQVYSTLPLGQLINMLLPALPDNILHLSRQIRFRNLILVALFLDKDHLTGNASIYFPDPDIPFTRGYEPKNRCPTMAPENKTSFVVEVPCYEKDEIWNDHEGRLVEQVIRKLTETGLFDKNDVSGYEVQRMKNAYPVLSREASKYNKEMIHYLSNFRNLTILGRNGRFAYTHTHDLMRDAKDATEEYLAHHASII